MVFGHEESSFCCFGAFLELMKSIFLLSWKKC